MIFQGKTYNVYPYDSQRSHPSVNLGVKLDLCITCFQNLPEPTAELTSNKYHRISKSVKKK